MRTVVANERRLPGPAGSRWVIGRADPALTKVRAAFARHLARRLDAAIAKASKGAAE